MIDRDLFESGVRRIGAEQELFLVDSAWRPAGVGPEILAHFEDSRLTTELGRFNLELNLDPQVFTKSALSALESQLRALLDRVQALASGAGAEVVLTGILPTLNMSHLDMDHMSPVPRYYALNAAMDRARGGTPYTFHIQGQDELRLEHDNVMFEACNTSFQVHYQVEAREFARLYNFAQVIAAPVLAAATNSPLLFGHRLWRETRIALFEQAVDTRRTTAHVRRQARRVSFGRRWVESSVAEIFEEDIARFGPLLATDVEEDPFQVLAEGGVPKLKALQLRNGTVYRWNRPCYGITDGKPHLRIENRVIPAGPTVLDELANAAFWLGLMRGLPEVLDDVAKHMDFEHARENFLAAARYGLGARFHWPGEKPMPARKLILETLLPIAHRGLEAASIDTEDRERFLNVIAERVATERTGSQWLLDSYQGMEPRVSESERLAALVSATVQRAREQKPVHQWELAQLDEAGASSRHVEQVEDLMSTDLLTVTEDEAIDVVAAVMNWRHIRRLPVESDAGELVGLVTHRCLLKILSRSSGGDEPLPVSSIMERDVVTVSPTMKTLDAIHLMREEGIGSLLVVDRENRLVGILTEHDIVEMAWPLLETYLGTENPVAHAADQQPGPAS